MQWQTVPALSLENKTLTRINENILHLYNFLIKQIIFSSKERKKFNKDFEVLQ